MRFSTLCFCLTLSSILPAQAPFTEKLFDWTLEPNLVYGAAVNYLGITDTLTLDLYKPISTDTVRPLLVLVHGGAWLGGCKEEIKWLCEEMVARGYVVATVNYRKGWHKDDYVPTVVNPAVYASADCLYPSDSTEIIRAMYRGMQDVKGAIRWLKARVYTDSTCNQAVLVGGESAGAFLALVTGLLDRPEEKPAACYSLPDAPIPGNNMANCYAVNCNRYQPALPPGALSRPDLGPVEGALNLNGFDANVQGILSLFGGLPSQALAENWMQGPDTPAIYLYHQTCDGVVPFNYGKPFNTLSNYCNLGGTPWHFNFPFVHGNGGISNYLAALPNPPLYQTDFLTCNSFDPNLALFECIRYADNGSYHYAHNHAQRAEKIAAFFSPVISPILANQPCLVSTGGTILANHLRLAPNPFSTFPVLFSEKNEDLPALFRILDQQGRLLKQQRQTIIAGANTLPWDTAWPEGLYFIQIICTEGAGVWKVVKQ